jgi:hypothetical protein
MAPLDTSIATIDLTNYNALKNTLQALYNKIKEGKRDDGNNNFERFYQKLFPDELNSTYGNKLKCTNDGLTEMNDNTISLKKLLHNTLNPNFNQTVNTGLPNYDKITNSSLGTTTKDHLCFIKLKSDKTDIEPDEHTITNILYSKYAIEIFIRIIKALINCSINYERELSLFSSTTRIYIVDRKLKNTDLVNIPKGIFISKNANEADSPPPGIYLYIGDLINMFKYEDIQIYNKDRTNDVPIDNNTKQSYVDSNSNSNKSIFTDNNNLQYQSGNKYYFGYLNYMDNSGDPVYTEQTGTTAEINLTDHPGIMTKMTLTNAKITGKISNTTLTNVKILRDAEITKVTGPGVASKTYKASGKILFDLSSGFTLKKNSTIDNKQNTVVISSTSAFTSTESSYSGKSLSKDNNTAINEKATVTINSDVAITNPITALVCDVSDFQFTTSTAIGGFNAGTTSVTLSDAFSANNVTITDNEIRISDVFISSSTANVEISSRFDKIKYTTDTKISYYEQNIYYIYNFLKMIYNIDNDSFLTTLQYLEVNLLCFKSLLLSSIRAANIFYNNRHNLSALAISYEENFLDNAAATAGSGVCAKLALNDFIKNGYTAKFGTCADATVIKLPEDTAVTGKVYQYILYKKKGVQDQDNNANFQMYDMNIQKEIKKIKNNEISSSASNVGIINFQLSNSFKVKSPFNISTDNSNNNDKLDGTFKQSSPDQDYQKIIDMFYYNKKNDFNKDYRIKIGGTTFKVTKLTIKNDNNSNKRVEIELEQNNDIPLALLNELNISSGDKEIEKNVHIVKITSKDIDKDYNNIVSNTNTVEENINMYKTKIKNNTTLYELHKSRNNLLYNQVLSYLIIVAVLIAILVIINIANVEKPLIKSITLGCLVVIIILFMTYYIMNTLYIEEGFAVDTNYKGYELCNDTFCKKNEAPSSPDPKKVNENHNSILQDKKAFVKNFLVSNANDIMLMITLTTPSIVNDSLKGNNEKLVTISKNIYNEKLYLNDVLYSKKSDSEMNVDVLKYENKNYDVYIVCILFLALIMVGSYTVNIYTDNKYMDLLILIMVILFVCLFTYFVLYTNRIVRTVSTNYYWGNQYEDEYI